MLKNISAIIFAVNLKLPSHIAIYDRKFLKFGETLTSNVDGNPEPSPKWSERCRDLTGNNLRSVKEKVRTIGKPIEYMNNFSSVPSHIPNGKKLPSLIEILGRKFVKFGETLTSNVEGNPEPSPKWSERCRDLTANKSERYLDEKVHSIKKFMGKMNNQRSSGYGNNGHKHEFPGCSFDREFDSPRGYNWWNFNRRIDSLRVCKKSFKRLINTV
tara:strand:+ start:933 stop:1574 length:642 start_codon:yes stop_codon:yes gene_type:complete